MQKSLYSKQYRTFLKLLKEARLDAGLTQSDVARRIRRPQSFVSKCESGERRIDVIEFLEYCRIYEVAPDSILERL
ncbi:MAG: helix-turn-helix domain-containing protein [Cyanobacteria bacterium RI_101]|nr:helix-turn-helix domain-containing protein [Cyanobacteria bacterium RI_101]